MFLLPGPPSLATLRVKLLSLPPRLYPFLLLYGAILLWSTVNVWSTIFSAKARSSSSSQGWELLCIGQEVIGRKCVVAAGWYVRDGLYLLAVGQSAVGIVAIGQVVVGVVCIGQLGAGVVFSAVLAGVNMGVIYGLMVTGVHSPRCIVGLTLFKDRYSQGVLNWAFLDTTTMTTTAGAAPPYQRVNHTTSDDDQDEDDVDDDDDGDDSHHHHRQHHQKQKKGWWLLTPQQRGEKRASVDAA